MKEFNQQAPNTLDNNTTREALRTHIFKQVFRHNAQKERSILLILAWQAQQEVVSVTYSTSITIRISK